MITPSSVVHHTANQTTIKDMKLKTESQLDKNKIQNDKERDSEIGIGIPQCLLNAVPPTFDKFVLLVTTIPWDALLNVNGVGTLTELATFVGLLDMLDVTVDVLTSPSTVSFLSSFTGEFLSDFFVGLL
jgi:hypothetical protein